jgi:hypothetical protein
MESYIMACNDGDPLRFVPTKTVPESLCLAERLRPPKQLAMNSRLPKRTVSSREKPLHVRHSSSVVTVRVDE